MSFNKKIYNELFTELEAKTGATKSELNFLLCASVSKVYGGINSALIWEDGTVTVAFAKDNEFLLKDYVVSKKQFTKILHELNTRLVKRIQKQDIESYINAVVSLSSIEFERKDLIVLPEKTKGFLFDYKLKILHHDLFKNDFKNLKAQNHEKYFFIEIKKANSDNKTIRCKRFSSLVAKKIFNLIFNELNHALGKEYTCKKNVVQMNYKSKKVEFFVEFRNKASGTFVSELSKRLNEILGNVVVHFKY